MRSEREGALGGPSTHSLRDGSAPRGRGRRGGQAGSGLKRVHRLCCEDEAEAEAAVSPELLGDERCRARGTASRRGQLWCGHVTPARPAAHPAASAAPERPGTHTVGGGAGGLRKLPQKQAAARTSSQAEP